MRRKEQVGKLYHDDGNTKNATGLLGRDLVILKTSEQPTNVIEGNIVAQITRRLCLKSFQLHELKEKRIEMGATPEDILDITWDNLLSRL